MHLLSLSLSLYRYSFCALAIYSVALYFGKDRGIYIYIYILNWLSDIIEVLMSQFFLVSWNYRQGIFLKIHHGLKILMLSLNYSMHQ